MKISLSVSLRRLLSTFSAAALLLLLCGRPSWGQTAGESQLPTADVTTSSPGPADSATQGSSTQASQPDSEQTSTVSGFGRSFPYFLPDSFKRRWLGKISAGLVHETGIQSSAIENGAPSSASYYDVGLSLAYDLPRKEADYMIEYGVSGRNYWGHSPLDTLTHDLGLNMHSSFGRRATWSLNYRFSASPDYATTLPIENLAQQSALQNPAPIALGSTSIGPPQTAADGLVTLRSTRLSNASNALLNYSLGARTGVSFGAGWGRVRFEDPNLFGNNSYEVSTGIYHQLSATVSAGLSYEGSRTEVREVDSRTLSQSLGVGISKQIGRRAVLSLNGGPSLTQTHNGQGSVPISDLVANFVGPGPLELTPSTRSIGWVGTAQLGTNIHNVGLSLSYERSVSSLDGLPGTALSQTAAVRLGKALTRSMYLASGLSYVHSDLLGVVDPTRLDQAGFNASLTQIFSRGFDMEMFYSYSRDFQGLHGPTIAQHNTVGISVVYNLRRLPFLSGA